MNKIIGYIMSIAGILGLAYTMIPQVQKFIPFLSNIDATILTVISVALILIGLFFVLKSSKRHKSKEVPIYQGKDIVGYRRTGK